MITKWKCFVVIIGILIGFYCCKKPVQSQQQIETVKDIHGYPISSLLKNDRVIYYFENGEEIIANIKGVEFNGGQDSLSSYLLTKYVNDPSYNNEEYNVYEYFFILFDKNLDIKDVRIMYRKHADNKRFYYDDIFIEALKGTNGMWNKIVDDKEWYIYLHRQMIY